MARKPKQETEGTAARQPEAPTDASAAYQPHIAGQMLPLDAEEKLRRREEKRKLSEPPLLTRNEQIGNAATHGIGAVLSVAATVLLFRKATPGLEALAAGIYGACMILLFSMSCLYHSFPAGSRIKRIWRRFDYSSIYLLIGGTFTPLLLLSVGGKLGIAVCCVQWVLILLGVTLLAVFGPGRFRKLHFAFYFSIGWSGLLFMPTIWRQSTALVLFILIGGAVYTFGMIPFTKKGQKNMHLLWHFFVLIGALLHWVGIYSYCF